MWLTAQIALRNTTLLSIVSTANKLSTSSEPHSQCLRGRQIFPFRRLECRAERPQNPPDPTKGTASSVASSQVAAALVRGP
jgi:hypothetical protein